MLQKVSQTILGRGLLDSTYIGHQIELCTVGRFFVMLDVVGESVVKFAVS